MDVRGTVVSRPPRFPYPEVGAQAPWAGYDAGRVMEAPVHYDWTKYVDPEGDSDDWSAIKIAYDVYPDEPGREEVFDYWPVAFGIDRDDVIQYVGRLRREGDRRIWGGAWTLGISRSAYWHAVLDLSGWPVNELRPFMIEDPEHYEPDEPFRAMRSKRKPLPFSVDERMNFQLEFRIP